ncbi:MAG: hypothetical protein O7G85_01380, partial [Planctomycetota bacterium]|nr:hypothetical protein [Planctomycetota bacterium]
MFHRRLLLLLCCMVAIVMLLGAQLVRLTIVERDKWLGEAESRLSQSDYLPTYRGRILDRNNNILAWDRPSYNVAVQYNVITGQWPGRKAERQARKELGREAWNEMNSEQRFEAAEARQPEWEAHLERLWYMIMSLGELDEDELVDRKDDIVRRVERIAADHQAKRLLASQKLGYEETKYEPVREQKRAHVILENVTDEVAFRFRRLAVEVPGIVEVSSTIRREYPWSDNRADLHRGSLPEPIRSDTTQRLRLIGVADHLVGAVRDNVWAEDVKRRPFRLDNDKVDLGGYRENDVVGSRGLERSYEDHLRGHRGMVRKNLETGLKTITEAIPGGDLRTTLDIRLQTRVQAILSPEFGLTRIQQYQLGWDTEGRPKPGKLPLGM